ncbi:DNA polymerase III subunit beta [Clostridium ljungdahlii]|uniref:Beta sliding clamp n=1 Tax=Clostridium ljungdahlii TaxID=1538 RepID=A0A162L9W6_9CLOT|nr:DNA polymerase III subunit beta [Clostridium ljungdahlii]OAA90736.1 DNA polymerase III subunit beta [Clostridium ljungdahlii]
MLFKVKKEIFQDSLEKVIRACGKANLNKNLDGVLIEVEYGKITLTCTDIITTIKTSFACTDFENGTVLVNAKFLLSYVKSLHNQELLIKTVDISVVIISEKSKSKIMSMDRNIFPAPKSIKKKIELNVISEELKRALKEVIFAVAQDETRPVLTGVLFQVNNGKLTLVALDGYRMSVSSIPVDSGKNISFIVPQKSTFELQRILENDEQNVSIGISKNEVVFTFSNTVISGVPLEESYIKWQKIIPENNVTVCLVNRLELLTALNRTSAILTGESNKLVKMSFTTSGKLDLSTKCSKGRVKEEIKVKDFQGSELKIAFNLKYLSDMLLAHEDDELEFSFSNKTSPVVIRKKNNNNYAGVVLPVRLAARGEN